MHVYIYRVGLQGLWARLGGQVLRNGALDT